MDDLPDNSRRHAPGWWVQLNARVSRFRRLLGSHWWIIILTTAIGVALGAWVVFQQKAVYISGGRMMVSGRINLPAGAVFSEELANFFGTQMELMRSAEVRDRAAGAVAAKDPELKPVSVLLAVSQVPSTSIFKLTATGGEPKYTQELLDATMTEYIATKRDMRSSKSGLTQTAFLEEVNRVEKEMRTGEQELLDFQKQNNIGFLQQEGNSAGAYLAGLNNQLADMKTQFQLFDKLDVDQIIDKSQNDPKQAGDSAARGADSDSQGMLGNGLQPEDQYLHAKQEMAVLQAQRSEIAKVMRPKHPEMVDIEQKISQQQTLIASFRGQSLERLASKKDSLRYQIENLETVIKEWDAKALISSQRLADYNKIKTNVDRSKGLYDRLVGNLHDIDMSRYVDQDMVSILETATPSQAIKPGMENTILLGLFGGLIFGVGILALLDQIDDRLSSIIDVHAAFDDQILGQLPSEKHDGDLRPLEPYDTRHALSESLRALRSSLLYMAVEGDRPKTLLITSAVPKEGKSTVALNLAITMALANVRVLLVDADMRRGRLNVWFGRDKRPGLSDLLSGRNTIEECLLPTSIENLDLIPRGLDTPNTGELILGNKLDTLLRQVYHSYEFIIFDSCPILAADDTTSLAPKIDATLFVVRLGLSSTRNSQKAVQLLRDRQANVIGLVCNAVSQSNQEYYHYKYPEYYGALAAEEAAPAEKVRKKVIGDPV